MTLHPFENIEDNGYEWAAENTYGRCIGDMTVFIQVDYEKDLTSGWVWDTKSEAFMGTRLELKGVSLETVEKAKEHGETLVLQEQLSGGVPRADRGPVEQA